MGFPSNADKPLKWDFFGSIHYPCNCQAWYNARLNGVIEVYTSPAGYGYFIHENKLPANGYLVEVRFCPFCGQQLLDIKHNEGADGVQEPG